MLNFNKTIEPKILSNNCHKSNRFFNNSKVIKINAQYSDVSAELRTVSTTNIIYSMTCENCGISVFLTE